jgi:hypothetical protein
MRQIVCWNRLYTHIADLNNDVIFITRVTQRFYFRVRHDSTFIYHTTHLLNSFTYRLEWLYFIINEVIRRSTLVSPGPLTKLLYHSAAIIVYKVIKTYNLSDIGKTSLLLKQLFSIFPSRLQ